MNGISVGLLALRAFEVICALIVLGLSANLQSIEDTCYDYYTGYAYACRSSFLEVVDYSIFVGVFALITSVVGIAQFFFVSTLFAWVTLALDGLTTLFFFVGGVALAVKYSDATGGYNCTYSDCEQAQADIAFLFIGFLATAAAGVLVLLIKRRD